MNKEAFLEGYRKRRGKDGETSPASKNQIGAALAGAGLVGAAGVSGTLGYAQHKKQNLLQEAGDALSEFVRRSKTLANADYSKFPGKPVYHDIADTMDLLRRPELSGTLPADAIKMTESLRDFHRKGSLSLFNAVAPDNLKAFLEAQADKAPTDEIKARAEAFKGFQEAQDSLIDRMRRTGFKDFDQEKQLIAARNPLKEVSKTMHGEVAPAVKKHISKLKSLQNAARLKMYIAGGGAMAPVALLAYLGLKKEK